MRFLKNRLTVLLLLLILFDILSNGFIEAKPKPEVDCVGVSGDAKLPPSQTTFDTKPVISVNGIKEHLFKNILKSAPFGMLGAGATMNSPNWPIQIEKRPPVVVPAVDPIIITKSSTGEITKVGCGGSSSKKVGIVGGCVGLGGMGKTNGMGGSGASSVGGCGGSKLIVGTGRCGGGGSLGFEKVLGGEVLGIEASKTTCGGRGGCGGMEVGSVGGCGREATGGCGDGSLGFGVGSSKEAVCCVV